MGKWGEAFRAAQATHPAFCVTDTQNEAQWLIWSRDELDVAMQKRDDAIAERAHAIAERDAAWQEAAHWRALYEAAAGVVRKLNIDAVKSAPHDWTRVAPGDRRMLGGDFTKFPV